MFSAFQLGCGCIFVSVFAFVTPLLRDGDIYRITSVSDGSSALTIGGRAGLSGSNVTAEPWQDGGNQKWLAVEATPDSGHFIFIPKWQSWNWNDFAKNSTKGQREHLPDFTLALTLNTKSSLLSNQGFTGQNVQQWMTVDGVNKAVLIKSLEDNNCITNPGEHLEKSKSKKGLAGKIAGIFKKDTKKVIAGVIHISTCEPTNTQQLWKFDLLV